MHIVHPPEAPIASTAAVSRVRYLAPHSHSTPPMRNVRPTKRNAASMFHLSLIQPITGGPWREPRAWITKMLSANAVARMWGGVTLARIVLLAPGVEEQSEDGEEHEIDAYNAGMSSNISPAELALLEYLHERSGMSGGRIGLDPKPITRVLRISMTRLAETSASLAALGLAGVRHNRASAEGVASTVCAAIWVTSKGQDYLKRAMSAADAAAAKARTPGE